MTDSKLPFRRSLVAKLILAVGLTLLGSISTWAYFNVQTQKQKAMNAIVTGTDRFSSTIKLGTHYAMMLNSRDDINQIINNIATLKKIESIRIYNKAGEIKFSNQPTEVDQATDIEAEACYICHRSDPPLTEVPLEQRTRIFDSPEGIRLLGIISPIRNEPSCATDACHVHPQGKKILGALDVVVSLQETDQQILHEERGVFGLAGFVFLITSSIIFVFVLRFVNRPIKKLIGGTRMFAKGEYGYTVNIEQEDEMGLLAQAINLMGWEIGQQQAELNQQRDEYQNLFEQVPCLVTVQDRNYRLIRYNREFADKFAPIAGDYCFNAYKGRTEKCVNCPVEKTFRDGLSHYSEESGADKAGNVTHWILTTSPIKNSEGDIIAAMEMSLDITRRKQLEEQLAQSEKKYHEIFSNIPNPVFVLDADSLEILDCNDSVKAVYGFDRQELIQCSFLDLFQEQERDRYTLELKKHKLINQVKHIHKSGKTLFVTLRISLSDYPGRKVWLVTSSDITQRLEVEQQLIQASKMATLGEMATGVAHELNQPLSVIKTASSFFIKKIRKNEPIADKMLTKMLTKIDANVDRATRIISHMREFARKSDIKLVSVQLNEVLERAFEIFSQQLKVRGIEVTWHIEQQLPRVRCDPGRMEQVFINLLLNARDAIEAKWGGQGYTEGDKRITLKTYRTNGKVMAEVCDTGPGIPQAIADKVFEPFYTTKEVGKGTGLGLSISYGIVKDCGGDIFVRSKTGQGACFYLTFPLEETKEDE